LNGIAFDYNSRILLLSPLAYVKRIAMAITLSVNGTAHTLDIEPEMPLLWALRETLGLTGAKFGCGVAACGACTVHLDGRAVRSCVLPVSAADGKSVTTIEGLAPDGTLHAVQQAWIAHQVPQCGYCQTGMIMAVTGLLAEIPNPTDDEIDARLTNICRCGTFARVRAAIHRAADHSRAAS
jgi:isoquinoline 1-oxidoreductase alpha subunit